jgi:CsoR family transcriptional regulator, copper-sensing transcriptional repressor
MATECGRLVLQRPYPLGVYSAAVTVGYAQNKDDLRARLHRIQGQVGGIERMVDDDRYCIDILTQVNAVKAALDKVALALLRDHVEHCVADAVRGGKGKEKLRELTAAIGRYLEG